MQAATDTHALQKLQRNRLRMTGISVVNFSLQTGVLALYAMAGTVQWWVVAAFLVAAPQLAFIFLVSLLVGYNLTMIAFDGRQYTIAWLLQAAATAAALYVAGDRMAYPGTSRAETAILWLFFVLCMHQLTAIGGQFSTLRAKLSQKNQQLRESLERIEQLASHDDLTGVLNRRSFMAQLAAEAARAQRSGMPFCVAVFDIDHFKAVRRRRVHPADDAAHRLLGGRARGAAHPAGCRGARLERVDARCRRYRVGGRGLLPARRDGRAAGVARRCGPVPRQERRAQPGGTAARLRAGGSARRLRSTAAASAPSA